MKPNYDFPIYDEKTDTIHQFKGIYSFLSNFADCEIEYNGYTYKSVEHAYIAQKSNDEDWKELCANGGYTAGNLKKVGKEIELREDWEEAKLEIMGELLLLKFKQEPFRTNLLETDNSYIEEGNWWGDEYWGVSFKTGKGDNHLGKLLMLIRNLLNQDMI